MGNVGIDYGLGRSNVDVQTGIRYGVISQNSVLQAWADSAEPEFGEPACPKCGKAVGESDQGKDYHCEACKYSFWSDEAFPDEALGYSYHKDGYSLTDCLDTDIFVLKSPYFTFAQFCSPCVPGAGNLDTPMPDGIKTYALGHDWFEDGSAPYPVYSVATGEEVKP